MKRKYWSFAIINLILINTICVSNIEFISGEEPFDINHAIYNLTPLDGWSYNFTIGEIHKTLLENESIFVAMGEDGLAIIDATEPTALHTVGTYQTNGSIIDLCIFDDVLYILLEDLSVEFIDIQNIENPTKIGEFKPSGEISCFTVTDNYLVVGNYAGGALEIGEVFLVDISNLSEPVILNKLEFHYQTFTKAIYNDNVLFLFGESGIRLLDFTEFIAGDDHCYLDYLSGVGFSDIARNGSILYTCFNGDLRTFDISDIHNVEAISWIQTGIHYDICLTKDNLYTRGIRTINIIAIPEKSTILKLEYEINNSILRDLVVEDVYIAVTNVGEGDDILLFKQTITTTEDTSNPIWPYIVGPVGGYWSLEQQYLE